ncbi:MAG: YybS family protein [Selenomonadaceae bacterium]|nr:YybS family protein [Selenomonadaceae bacterium]
MNTSTRPVVEGGLLIAVALLMGLASVYLPILGTIIEFFWAVPFTVLAVRQGLNKAITGLVAATVLLMLFVGPLLALRLSLSFGPVGLAIGWCIRQKHDAVRIFITTLGAAFAGQILSIAIIFFVMDIDFMQTQTDLLQEMFDETLKVYEEMGMDEATLTEARETVEPTITLALLLMPTVIVLMALINAAASFWASKAILKKLDIDLPEFPRFAEWRFPIGFLYMLGFALIGMYWGVTRNIEWLHTMSINANVLAMLAGFVQGLSLMSFAADHFKLSKIIRRLLFLVVLLNGMLLQAVAFTGLFDMYFDYRKRLTRKKD